MHISIFTLVCAQLFSLLVGIYSYKKGSVSTGGFTALILISSTIIWLQEIAFLFALFYMFASSSLLSKLKPSKEENLVIEKAGARDHVQALANLGTATALIIFFHFYPNSWLVAAIIGSIAAANADSWASEIGSLSKKQPVSITNFKPLAKGISGGVTLLGTLGGVAGSLFIVASSLWTMHYFLPFSGNIQALFYASLFAGIAGCFTDSFLGAWFQALYKESDSGIMTESTVKGVKLVKGFSWVNNDMVNFLTTLSGAFFGAILYLLLT